jgi:hypothetical protein
MTVDKPHRRISLLKGSVVHHVQFAVSGRSLMKCVSVSPKLPECRWVATSVAAGSADRYILKVRL